MSENEKTKLVTGRRDWEREIDGAVPEDRDVDLSRDPPEYEGDLVIDGVSVNALAKKRTPRK